jgi:hypothetical protein
MSEVKSSQNFSHCVARMAVEAASTFVREDLLVFDFDGDVGELGVVEDLGLKVFEVVAGELVSEAYLVEQDVLFERGDVDHVDVVEHCLAVEAAKDDDLVEAEDVRGVALAAVHESERLLRSVFRGLVPGLLGEVEANEFVGFVLGIVAAEDVDAVADAVGAVATESVEDFVLVLDLSPGVGESVELV